MITSSNSLCRERDAQSSGRCPTSHHVRFRAVPRTNRTLTTVNTHSHSATSNTTGSPAGAPSLPWQCSCVDASPGECTDVASQDGPALLLGPPPPARSATRNCPVCRCAPAVACQHWTPHSDRVECVELYFWEIDDMAKQACKRKNGAKADATVGLWRVARDESTVSRRRVPLPPRTHENNGQNPGLRYLATLGSETRYLCGTTWRCRPL